MEQSNKRELTENSMKELINKIVRLPTPSKKLILSRPEPPGQQNYGDKEDQKNSDLINKELEEELTEKEKKRRIFTKEQKEYAVMRANEINNKVQAGINTQIEFELSRAINEKQIRN